MQYAKFWMRLLAVLIDNIICLLSFGVLSGFSGYVLGTSLTHLDLYLREMTAVGSGLFLFILFRWLYFTLFESAEYQATLAKMLFGIKVIDNEGSQISFGRANARYWSKTLSVMTLGIGFLIALGTKKSRGLHDLIAKTFVVKSK